MLSKFLRETISVLKSIDSKININIKKVELDVKKLTKKISKKKYIESHEEPARGTWIGERIEIDSLAYPSKKLEIPSGIGIFIQNSESLFSKEDEPDIFSGYFNFTGPHGIGKYDYPCRQDFALNPFTIPSYIGEWKAGARWGIGRLVYSNGDEYQGNFRYDVPDGFGCYTFKTNDDSTIIKEFGFTRNGNLVGFYLHLCLDIDGNLVFSKNDKSGLCFNDGKSSSLVYFFDSSSNYKTYKIIKEHKKIIDSEYYQQVLANFYWHERYEEKTIKDIIDNKTTFDLLLFHIQDYMSSQEINKNFESKIKKFMILNKEYYNLYNDFHFHNKKSSKNKISSLFKLYVDIYKKLSKKIYSS